MNFDDVVDRYNTNCLKFDFKQERNKPEDIFPMWVADMDFRCPPEVINDLKARVEHGIFGYSDIDITYFRALYSWYLTHFNVKLQRDWLFNTPGVVFALATAVKVFTKENDYVLINNPVYNPFSEVIEDNHRQILSSDLINNNGHYEIDFNDLEQKIKEYNIKLYLLCSPHNPVGRVWSKEELDKIVEICKRYNVFIVSDEIHSDFVYEGKHICMLNYQDYLDNIIVCTSPSKTFNLAGLQTSNILIPNKEVKDKFMQEVWATGYSNINALGLVACKSAYEHGDKWLKELLEYLKGNVKLVEEYMEQNLPNIKVTHPEGTYLLWIDFSGTNLSDDEIINKLTYEAKLWLNSGIKYGKSGKGFQRLNIALPRSELQHALEKIKKVFG